MTPKDTYKLSQDRIDFHNKTFKEPSVQAGLHAAYAELSWKLAGTQYAEHVLAGAKLLIQTVGTLCDVPTERTAPKQFEPLTQPPDSFFSPITPKSK